jgi:hypothetical protein
MASYDMPRDAMLAFEYSTYIHRYADDLGK